MKPVVKESRILRAALFALLLACGMCFVSCNSDKDKSAHERKVSLGKYIFKDDSEILHIDEKCRLISRQNKRGYSTYPITPVDTSEIMSVERVCAKCFNDVAYDHLRDLCVRNKVIDCDRRWLYNILNRNGYEQYDYDIFIHYLANEQRRRRLYSTAQKEGWDVGSYEEFSEYLGF